MNDLQRARELLESQPAHTCVLVKGGKTHISTKRGIAPMIDFLDSGADLSGFCAADRIVGRAAAMLFCRGGIRAVWAEVITVGAIEFLTEKGIEVAWGEQTDIIVNRRGDGPCPMEKAVQDLADPDAGEREIRKTLASLLKK